MKLEELEAYDLVEKQELPEVKGTGYVLSHKKTKARVLVVCNDDNNKVFTIGFRTPPENDMGIPHIMEHSVLCGSKKFPAKDPFVELCKGSLNTFLNAMTYSDKTVYPVASLNKKDFHNLMHVYLDAVFYPNIYGREEIMQQEGWHYELDEETGELKYNGVVFNEMKGVFSSPEQQLYRVIEKSLHEHTAYSYESGGDPVYITDLDRETFLDFHGRYYHPSNSYIYLYGDMDAAAELAFIDREYLSAYEYLDINSALTDEPDFDAPMHLKEEYSLADAEEEVDNTYLTYNVRVGKSTEKKLCMAFSIIEHALLDAPGAPLKKALIDAGIGMDVFSSYDDGIKQPTFSIVAKNANEADEARFIKTIDDTLCKIVKDGINKRSFLAAINYYEFKHKEGNFGRYPKGLMLGLNAFSTWLYDDNEALSTFSLNEIFDELKIDVEHGYFEKLITEYIVENKNKTYVMLVPRKGLNNVIEENEKSKLAKYKETLTKQQLDAIVKNAEALKEYQSEPSTPEELRTIPLLEISDIEKEARKLNNQISEIEMVKIVSHNIFTNGISYVNLNFDISDIDYGKYPYIALLSEIFKYVDTEHYSYNDLANEINLQTGGIGFDTTVSNTNEPDKINVHFIVNAKMLDDKLDVAMDLINEILFSSKIDDKKRLREIISETRVNMKNDLVASGHTTAAGRALSYISPIGVVKELTEGVDYYKFLEGLDKDFETIYEELAATLRSVLGEVLRRGGLTISYTSDKNPKEMLTASVTKLSKLLSTRASFDNSEVVKPIPLNEGFKTASQVQYVATAGNYKEKGLSFRGDLCVLQSIFSYDYLWLNVRVKGGAYGCMCAFARSGNVYFTSYRDPNLMETYNIYKGAPEYVRTFDADDRDMTKYIIGAVSKLDSPLTPSAEGAFSFAAYLMGITDEDLQNERNQVLSSTVESIRALAPYVEAAVENDIICVIGNENKLEAAKDNFKTVASVF
ncbi:MAG: insulinase family protein [Clostridium sp.]|nr:insulinase family protein [Clostridium sp.]MCM1398070.1 insulinase family protein [Clostridium sp.]MCM1459295.1 insulinase family protein [Bacteroides sp.]